MTLFKGASAETFRMKEKPIKEGFKSWALCDSGTGYVISFTPARRTKGAVSEYHVLDGKQFNSILRFLLTFFPPRPHIKRTIVMDNLFTTAGVVQFLRSENIGVLGTLRTRRNAFPTKEYKEAGSDLKDFNSGVWDLDEMGTLVLLSFLFLF